ncbi:pyocin activator PrtN family protein [Pseudomonas tussilaginis]|uniref:pyocin activator PrtN family protein n=1 Tax=Pseudomonas sp. 5 TaxID=1619949 RepID=UPI0005EBC2C4|nr:pyocin activator PrtN family protein [Pseudomonas sp. 5]KJK06554.1 transcriptional regulator [Pseudomonas sp. 5]
MSRTYDQLCKQFNTPCPTLTEVREHYFPHIRTDRYLLSEISAGRIQLKVSKFHGSGRTIAHVYLHHLADFLDAKAREVA